MWRSELEALISSSDALILPMGRNPYPDASLPIKFIEYLWAGKPIIYIGVGYPKILIDENSLGITASADELSRITDYIDLLANDKDLVAQIGKRSKMVAEHNFSRQIFSSALSKVFLLGSEDKSYRPNGTRAAVR
jgi:glycosyltransferase involved in cell wall biosynthesis